MGWLIIIWVINAAISWWNAHAVGKSWAEAKAAGGWPRIMAWAGAVMADCGFTWCILILLVFGAGHFYPQVVTQQVMDAALGLGFIILIPGFLISGLAIMLDSWRRAFRQGGVLNYGMAAYNTYAQIHNTFAAYEGLGAAFKSIGDLIGDRRGSRDDKNGNAMLILIVVLIVVIALLAGTLLTIAIIRNAAASEPLLSPDEMRSHQPAGA